ncbi:ABC transporter permease subunit [Mycoplasma sp. SG1]|uniref:ABC transporter permease subunit n=1 Tax=Mycoplasma sp. SG1 TaxID=2810348 RepID=UPI002024EA1E|nr:ABC transporter permease subunit [Mycoplasma sp. SG1]URM52926.1 ABC transporter permease subunit [Mycoplasma sp. SG1]
MLFFVIISFIISGILIGLGVQQNTLTIETQLNNLKNILNVSFFTIFICTIYLIFMAVKATQVFRDEIEDGTILLVLSKPINRKSLLAQKWCSYQLIGIIFLFSNLFWIIGISSFFATLTAIGHLLQNIIYILIFSLMCQFIFSSIFLLLSLSFSSKTLIIIAVLVVIFLIFLNILVPLLTVSDLKHFFNNSYGVKSVSREGYNNYMHQANLFYYLSFINFGYHLENMFNFVINGFNSGFDNTNTTGFLSQFGHIAYPKFTILKSGVIAFKGWEEFISPILLYGIYGGLVVVFLGWSWLVLRKKDFV